MSTCQGSSCQQAGCKTSKRSSSQNPPAQANMRSCEDCEPKTRTQDSRKLLWHLQHEVPIFGNKLAQQREIVEADLPSFIEQHWYDQEGARADIVKVLEQKSRNIQPKDGWWSFTSEEVSHMSLSDLMIHYQCEGLLDWSCVSLSDFKQEYTYLVVTSGLGCGAMMHEGPEKDWLTSLHRDVLCDWCAPHNLFCLHVDTLVVGLVGRKRVVLLPPEAAAPTWCASGKVDLTCCSGSELRNLRHLSFNHGWTALEKHAMEVGGFAYTVCAGTYCLIPSGWWHILRPLDDITAIVTPTFRQGCWNTCVFDS